MGVKIPLTCTMLSEKTHDTQKLNISARANRQMYPNFTYCADLCHFNRVVRDKVNLRSLGTQHKILRMTQTKTFFFSVLLR